MQKWKAVKRSGKGGRRKEVFALSFPIPHLMPVQFRRFSGRLLSIDKARSDALQLPHAYSE